MASINLNRAVVILPQPDKAVTIYKYDIKISQLLLKAVPFTITYPYWGTNSNHWLTFNLFPAHHILPVDFIINTPFNFCNKQKLNLPLLLSCIIIPINDPRWDNGGRVVKGEALQTQLSSQMMFARSNIKNLRSWTDVPIFIIYIREKDEPLEFNQLLDDETLKEVHILSYLYDELHQLVNDIIELLNSELKIRISHPGKIKLPYFSNCYVSPDCLGVGFDAPEKFTYEVGEYLINHQQMFKIWLDAGMNMSSYDLDAAASENNQALLFNNQVLTLPRKDYTETGSLVTRQAYHLYIEHENYIYDGYVTLKQRMSTQFYQSQLKSTWRNYREIYPADSSNSVVQKISDLIKDLHNGI